MTQPEWDDDRLAAAFHGRFDRRCTRRCGEIESTGRSPRSGRPIARLPCRLERVGRAAAAVLVVAVGGGRRRVADHPIGRRAVASSPGPTSAADRSAVPLGRRRPARRPSWGWTSSTVSDALAVRDAGQDDRELAVAGWITPIGPSPVRTQAS